MPTFDLTRMDWKTPWPSILKVSTQEITLPLPLELAENADKIGNLNISPDLLSLLEHEDVVIWNWIKYC